MLDPILLAIKPAYAEAILDGSKTIELRRRMACARKNLTCVLYSTAPVKSVVGSFKFERVVEEPISILWKEISAFARIEPSSFYAYFAGQKTGIGIYIKEVRRFRKAVCLNTVREIWPSFSAPQSYIWLPWGKYQDILKHGNPTIPKCKISPLKRPE